MKLFKLIILVLCLACTACKEKLVHGLSENEVNKLMAQLYAVNASPEKIQQADGKWTLAVPSAQAQWVMKYLEDARVIRDANDNAIEASSIVSSRDEQRFKFERSLSREIEYTLSSIEDVLQARVHLNLPPRDPFLGRKINDAEQGSASVLLIVTQDFNANDTDVQNLVAGAAGIEKEAVTIMLNRSDISLKSARKGMQIPSDLKVQQVNGLLNQEIDWEIVCSILILLCGIGWVVKKKIRRKSKNLSAIAEALQKQSVKA